MPKTRAARHRSDACNRDGQRHRSAGTPECSSTSNPIPSPIAKRGLAVESRDHQYACPIRAEFVLRTGCEPAGRARLSLSVIFPTAAALRTTPEDSST
jgi:hypothetical protein